MIKIIRGLKLGFIVPFYTLFDKDDRFIKRLFNFIFMIIFWPYIFYISIKGELKSKEANK